MGLLRDKETYHPLKFTVEEYLDDEKSAPERREYIGGEVFAMAGASEEHEKVALNVASAFLAHLRGSGCKVFKGDMKLRCKPSLAETFYYPDVFVTCSPKDTNPIYKTEPRLIVEVQSDWKRDQFEKRFVYQQVDSLEEYLIIDPESEAPKAWLYQRSRDWADRVLVPPESVLLESIDLELSFDQIYESL